MGCGCKSAPAAAPSCGCEAAAPSCGCEAAPAVEASPCDCEAAVVEASPCGCDAAPAVEASPCGCDAAPAVAATPCGAPAAVIPSGCGCNAAPAVSTCGCNEPSGGGGPGSYAPGGNRPKLTLLDRLRGNRVARNRDGKVIGVCNDGCNPPCPQKPVDCGCGGGEYIIEAAPCSSCNTCGGGEVIYSDAMPTSGCASGACGGATPVYGDGVALPAAVSEGSGSRVEPVAPAMTEGTLQGVEEVEETERRDITQPSVSDEEDDPIVDPGAFVPRPTNTLGS